MTDLFAKVEEMENAIEKDVKLNPAVKLSLTLLAISIIVLLSGYIAWLTGNRYFLLPEDTTNWPPIAHAFIRICLYHTSFLLMLKLIAWPPWRACFIITLSVVPIYLLLCMVDAPSIILALWIFYGLPYVVGLLIKTQTLEQQLIPKFNKYIVATVSLFLAAFLHQSYGFGALFIKTALIPEQVGNINTMSAIFVSLDQYIFVLILICLKGALLYGLALERRLDLQSAQDTAESDEFLLQVKKLTIGKRLLVTTILGAFYIAQFFIILALCRIGNVLIEGSIISSSYFICGVTVFKKRWHARTKGEQNGFLCTLLTGLVFYAAARFSIPVQYSFVLPVIIGMLIAYSLFLITKLTFERSP